jgi:hypothetical protein
MCAATKALRRSFSRNLDMTQQSILSVLHLSDTPPHCMSDKPDPAIMTDIAAILGIDARCGA